MQQFRHARSFRAPGGIKNATFSPRHDWTVTKNKKNWHPTLDSANNGCYSTTRTKEEEQKERRKQKQGSKRSSESGVALAYNT